MVRPFNLKESRLQRGKYGSIGYAINRSIHARVVQMQAMRLGVMTCTHKFDNVA